MTSVNDFAPPLQETCVGISLKSQHFPEILQKRPDVDFFEIHAENYMSDGGAHHRYLTEIAENYKLSVHGVGMSLGSAEGLSKAHMKRLKQVIDRYNPVLVSEHLAWTKTNGIFLNDLLPLPLNEDSYRVVKANVSELQDFLGRRILVENPSVYVAFDNSDISEPDFLNRLAAETKCGLLLDLNNIYVSAINTGGDAKAYLDRIDARHIGEAHLAGHVVRDMEDGSRLLVDDHGSEVCDEVWQLYNRFCVAAGTVPTLVEWDNNIPDLDVLQAEAERARTVQTAQLQEQIKHAV